MQEHESSVTMICLTTTPDGSLGVVPTFKIGAHGYAFARRGVTGEWLASMVDALGHGGMSFGTVSYQCRVRVTDSGDLLELGRADGSYWFAVDAAPDQTGAQPITDPWDPRTPAGKALRYLNKRRALVGRRDLDPRVTGHTTDDVIADALFYGWPG